MITPYTVVQANHHWSHIDKILFAVACVALGWILASSFNEGLDSFICDFGRGEAVNFNGIDWRRE